MLVTPPIEGDETSTLDDNALMAGAFKRRTAAWKCKNSCSTS
jgi:hypothetical protein